MSKYVVTSNYIETCHSDLYVQEVKTGRTPMDLEAYMQGHRDSDPQNPDVLCTQTATDCLVSFWYFSMCLCINLMVHLYLVCLPPSFILDRRWFSAMGSTMTGGASQLTVKQHMLAQEDNPMDGKSISFGFQSYAHISPWFSLLSPWFTILSPWFTLVGLVFFILRLILGS
jgi:hypothetical protein